MNSSNPHPHSALSPRRLLLGLIASLATATAVLALAAPAKSAVPRDFYGLVPQATPTTAEWAQMGAGKVGTLRIGIFWSAVDGAAPAGGYDFSTIDPIVANAARQGIEILPYLYGTPDWVAKGLDRSKCRGGCGTYAPRSKAALKAYAGFVGAAVQRYGSKGTFWSSNPAIPKQPVRAWQIWNEQNSKVFYAPKAKPQAYAKMLASASRAVNSKDRRADVVLGGMPQLGGSKKAIAGTKYLRKLYAVKGVEKHFDGVAVHPYGAKVKAVISQVKGFRKEITRARDARTDLWITETGWSSASGGNPLNVGLKGQAARLKQSFSYFKRNRGKLNIEAVTWYSFKDMVPAVCEWCGTSGLLSSSGAEKPAWQAFTKFTGGN